MCNNSDLLIGFVYGEIDAHERAAIESHLATCAACRNEVAELRAARGHLAAWTPPQPDFGFQIVRSQNATPAPADGARVLRPARWFKPAWGLAAAAVLVLAAAAAIANVEIRYDAQGLVVRTGWARDAAPVTANAQTATASGALVPVSREELGTLNRRLAELERIASTQNAAVVQAASGPRMSDAEILRRMREMLNTSEARQQRELATQITQVIRDVDTVRQIDYARYQQGIGQLRGQTAAEVANQFNRYLSRVSQEK